MWMLYYCVRKMVDILMFSVGMAILVGEGGISKLAPLLSLWYKLPKGKKKWLLWCIWMENGILY